MMRDWLIDRLREPSTWRGIALLASVGGIVVTQDEAGALCALVVAVIGVYDAVRKERRATDRQP